METRTQGGNKKHERDCSSLAMPKKEARKEPPPHTQPVSREITLFTTQGKLRVAGAIDLYRIEYRITSVHTCLYQLNALIFYLSTFDFTPLLLFIALCAISL